VPELIRASGVVKCELALVCLAFLSRFQAPISSINVCLSGMRRPFLGHRKPAPRGGLILIGSASVPVSGLPQLGLRAWWRAAWTAQSTLTALGCSSSKSNLPFRPSAIRHATRALRLAKAWVMLSFVRWSAFPMRPQRAKTGMGYAAQMARVGATLGWNERALFGGFFACPTNARTGTLLEHCSAPS
jgi:hypothetical protein